MVAPARRRLRRRSPALRILLAGAVLLGLAAAHLASGAPSPGLAGDLPALLPASLRPSERFGAAARKALLDTYAPVVLLAPGERTLPADVQWYLARSRLEHAPVGGIVKAAVGAVAPARLRPSPGARGGSEHVADWTVYGHVYRAADGGVLIQYWFFYA
jgi:hypothetical protein